MSLGVSHDIGNVITGADADTAYVVDRTDHDAAAVNVVIGQVLRRVGGFDITGGETVAVNWAGTRMLFAGTDGSYFDMAWGIANPQDGTIIAQGVTAGVGGYVSGALALCPRHVPDPAPSASQPTQPTQAATPAIVTRPMPVATALDRPRTSRAAGHAVVSQSVRLHQRGRYTFIYEAPNQHCVPLLRGSTLGRRVLGKVFTAPVTTTQGPADRVAIRARLGRTSASGVRLRVVYRSADGTLCDASLPSHKPHAAAIARPPGGCTAWTRGVALFLGTDESDEVFRRTL